jgi:hypothetical protein
MPKGEAFGMNEGACMGRPRYFFAGVAAGAAAGASGCG